jgi:hypothetical protein
MPFVYAQKNKIDEIMPFVETQKPFGKKFSSE